MVKAYTCLQLITVFAYKQDHDIHLNRAQFRDVLPPLEMTTQARMKNRSK